MPLADMPDHARPSRRRRWWWSLPLIGLTALTASLCLHASIGDYATSTQFVDGKFRNTTPKPANAPRGLALNAILR